MGSTDSNEGVISVKLCNTQNEKDKSKHDLQIQIADTDIGIPKEQQGRIFEPFFTTKAPGHGLGLGLDTAQRIVRMHRGYLTVLSSPGKTCFQVGLPLQQTGAY